MNLLWNLVNACIVKNMQLHIVHEKLERPYGIVET
jgi:hypothetical protein